MHHLVVVVLALLTLVSTNVHADIQETTINFGISLGLEPITSDSLAYIQTDSHAGLLVWQDWWNSLPASLRTTPYNHTLKFNLTVFENYYRFDTPQDRIFLGEQVHNMSIDSSIDFMFPPVGSPWGTSLRKASLADGRAVTIGLQDSRSVWYAVPGSFGAPTSTHKLMSSALPYLRVNKAKTATVIRTIEPFQGELCDGFISQAPYNDLHVTKVINVTFNYTTFGAVVTPEAVRNWTAILDQVVEQNADVLVICDYGIASEYALKKLRERQYTPKAMLLSYLFSPFEDETLLDYVLLPTGYEATANYPPQPHFTDAKGYDALVRAKHGRAASPVTAYATLAGMIVGDAMRRSVNNSSAELIRNILNTNLDTFMGTASFDIKGRSLIDSLLVQFLNGTHRVIGPALATAHELIYPMPTWAERHFENKWGHATEIAAVVLIAIAGLILVGWTIVILINWNHKRIVAASPLFCLVLLFGAVIVLVSLFSWMPGLVSDSMCNVRPWMLPLGFMTMFGALIVKTHRIHTLYNTKGLKIIVVSNMHVALELLGILAIQAILSILMVTVAKLQSHIHIVDPFRPSHNYATCTFSTALKILFYTNIGFVIALWVAGSYLAFKVKKIAISAYDESQVIVFAIYNTAVCGTVSMVIHLAIGNSNRYLVFMVMVVCCIVGTLGTTCMLFIPKLMHIRKTQSVSISSTSDDSTRYTKSAEQSYQGEKHNFSLKPVTSTTSASSHAHINTDAEEQGEMIALKMKNRKLDAKNRKLTAANQALIQENERLKAQSPII